MSVTGSGVVVNDCSDGLREKTFTQDKGNGMHISLLSKQQKYSQFESVNLDDRSNIMNLFIRHPQVFYVLIFNIELVLMFINRCIF